MDNKKTLIVNTALLHNPVDSDKDIEVIEVTKDTSVWEVIKASKNLKLRLFVLAIPLFLIFVL
jgi:hypothetical protein